MEFVLLEEICPRNASITIADAVATLLRRKVSTVLPRFQLKTVWT
jgi:hypothetical protein